MSARLVYVMGPSGAGKDSLLGWLRQHLPPTSPLHWAQRTISRPLQQSHARGTEQYESVCPATFAALRSEQAFALHWDANGLGYGVRHAQLAPLAQGRWVLVNGSRAHLPQALATLSTCCPCTSQPARRCCASGCWRAGVKHLTRWKPVCSARRRLNHPGA